MPADAANIWTEKPGDDDTSHDQLEDGITVRKANSWACTWWTLRTSGQDRSLCLATFRDCDAMADRSHGLQRLTTPKRPGSNHEDGLFG